MTNKFTTFLCCTFALLFTLNTNAQQNLTGVITHDGLERDYRIHFPPNFDSADELPLVFNLHGYTSNASQQELYSAMNGVSDDGNFIVCYPNGIDNSWNVGLPGGSSADDVGFLNDLVDTLHSLYNVNLNRVYSCGMSNGGYMSYKLACESSDRIAAIASVTGSIVPGNEDDCEPTRAVPVMEIHGTNDPTVAYDGSFFALPIEEVVQFWVDKNDCLSEPDTIDVPNINTQDGSTAQRIEYLNCDDEAEVVFYKVQNGGHTWPGAPIALGTTNYDFDASIEIWEFFNRFSLDGAITSVENEVQVVDIQLFPNPATDRVVLKNLPSEVRDIRFLDATGRVVKQVNVVDGEYLELSIEELEVGFYWVLVSGERLVESLKMVKH